MTLIITLLILNLISVVKSENMESKIVGGAFSSIGDFPHSVYVTIQCGEKATSCGASILNQAILLTAAHCISKCHGSFNITAYTGAERKNKGVANNVIDFKVHKSYDPNSKANDIGLLRLEKDLKFGRRVKRVIIMREPPRYTNAVIAGWGWIDSKGTKSDLLKHTKQNVYTRSRCVKTMNYIPLGTLCGTDLLGISYPEKGDSGSALVIQNSIQIGIVSFKKRQMTNATIIYTDVSYFYDWILENAEKLYCDHKDTKQRLIKKNVWFRKNGIGEGKSKRKMKGRKSVLSLKDCEFIQF